MRFPAHLGDHANKSEGTSAAASEQGQAQEFLGKSRRLCRMRSGLVLIGNFFRPGGQFVHRTCDLCLSLRCYRLSRCTSALSRSRRARFESIPMSDIEIKVGAVTAHKRAKGFAWEQTR